MRTDIDQYEQDHKWLLDNGFTTINAAEFSDRVARDMADNNTYDSVEIVRNQVAIDMLMEQ